MDRSVLKFVCAFLTYFFLSSWRPAAAIGVPNLLQYIVWYILPTYMVYFLSSKLRQQSIAGVAGRQVGRQLGRQVGRQVGR